MCNQGGKRHTKKYKTLLKLQTNKCKDTPCSWIGRCNIVKMTVPHKAIYMFNVIPIKIPGWFFFPDIEKSTFKCTWNLKGL